jgi:hypothetical protein
MPERNTKEHTALPTTSCVAKDSKEEVSAAQVENPHLASRLPQGRPGAESVAGIESYLAGLTGGALSLIHSDGLPLKCSNEFFAKA